MYLYITNEIGEWEENILGLFDLDTSTGGSRITAEYLKKNDILDACGGDLPRTFLVCRDKNILSSINTQTLLKRLKQL